MMHSAQKRQFNDFALVARFNRPQCRAVLAQKPVRAVTMIIVQLVGENKAQVIIVQHDDVVQAFPADRADQSFDHGILPRGTRRNELLFQIRVLDSAHQVGAIDGIPIPEEITWWGGKWEGVDHLLGGPDSRGSVRDAEVKNFAPCMGQDQKDIQHLTGGRRNGKEIDGNQLLGVVMEKSLPGLS